MGKSLMRFKSWDTNTLLLVTTLTAFCTSVRGKWLQLGWLAWRVGFHPQRWASSPSLSSSSSALPSWPFASAVKGTFIQTSWPFITEPIISFNTFHRFVTRWFCDRQDLNHRWFDQQSRDLSDLIKGVSCFRNSYNQVQGKQANFRSLPWVS